MNRWAVRIALLPGASVPEREQRHRSRIDGAIFRLQEILVISSRGETQLLKQTIPTLYNSRRSLKHAQQTTDLAHIVRATRAGRYTWRLLYKTPSMRHKLLPGRALQRPDHGR